MVAICNGNLELLKKICLDMATNFENKLVESFSNQSKTTADVLHENHQVLNAACQEMIDKGLIRGDEQSEALWRRVTSLESTIQDADEKSTLIEEKMNKLSFKVDHAVNALAELQLKFECVADSKQALGKSDGLGKSSVEGYLPE